MQFLPLDKVDIPRSAVSAIGIGSVTRTREKCQLCPTSLRSNTNSGANDPAVAVPSRPLPLIPGLPARMTSTPVVQVVNRYECSRYCRVLGRLSWNCQTRQDLLILVSMLGTSQAQPFETHENVCVLCS